MLNAGYSLQTADTPSLVEQSRTYKVVLQEIVDTNAIMLQLMNNSMLTNLEQGEFDTLDMDTKSKIMQRMVDVHNKLTPKVTVKQEETGADGVKRTLWSEKQA